MRRNDREITDRAEIDAVLREAQVCRLALADGGEPYVVPLCFGYDGKSIYLHSAPAGKKISMIERNPRCCFEVDLCDGLIRGNQACSWGMRYRSVIGSGSLVFITDPEEKKHGLTCIMQQYQGGGSHEFSEKELAHVCVLRIDIGEMTGKKHG